MNLDGYRKPSASGKASCAVVRIMSNSRRRPHTDRAVAVQVHDWNLFGRSECDDEVGSDLALGEPPDKAGRLESNTVYFVHFAKFTNLTAKLFVSLP